MTKVIEWVALLLVAAVLLSIPAGIVYAVSEKSKFQAFVAQCEKSGGSVVGQYPDHRCVR